MVSQYARDMRLKVAGFCNRLPDEIVFEHEDFEVIFRRYEDLVCGIVGPPLHLLDRRQKNLARVLGLTANAPRAGHGLKAAINDFMQQRRKHGAIYKCSRPMAMTGASA